MARDESLSLAQEEPRRKHQRKAVDLRATIEYLDPEGGWYPVQGWVTEVSLKGLRLRLPKDVGVSIKDRVRIFIHKPGIETSGKIKHITSDDASHLVLSIGIKLTEMSREHWTAWQIITG